jgi:hypothetical protein
MTRQQKEMEDLKESAYNAGFNDATNNKPLFTTWPKEVMMTKYREGYTDGLRSRGKTDGKLAVEKS